MKKVLSIKNSFGEELPLHKMDIMFVGDDMVYAKFKGTGNCFAKMYGPCDGYTVTIEN